MPDVTGPATLAGVKLQLGFTDTTDDERLDSIVDAVNGVVRALPVTSGVDLTVEPFDAAAWPAGVVLGANMLAARLYRRKDSAQGVVDFGANGPVYVQRNDPDIALLLQMGDYAKPGVG